MLTLPSQLSSSGDGLAETEQQTTHSVSPLPLRGRSPVPRPCSSSLLGSFSPAGVSEFVRLDFSQSGLITMKYESGKEELLDQILEPRAKSVESP